MGLLFLIGIGAIGAGYAMSARRHRQHQLAPPPMPVKADGSPCACVCHTQPGIVHVAACCMPAGSDNLRELAAFSPKRGHYGHYDASGNYRRE